jgi:hypothetical protein
MVRLMGILTGSALAVALLIVTLGIPQLEPRQPQLTAPPEPVAKPDSEPVPAPQPIPQPEPVVVELPEAPTDVPPEPAMIVQETPLPIEQQWYAFWSPFRSKVAADGFVSQLQRTTGLDYRVVRLKPGVYEVAFAYSDDSDIQDKLAQISSATGLELPGG